MEILIRSPKIGEIRAVLEKSLAPKTVSALSQALPLKARARRWGKEVYFETPVEVDLEKGAEVVGLGPSEVLMIGDRLDTDIAGAQALGMDTALVLSGVTKPEDLTEARIRPTYVAYDLLELVAGAKES